MINTPMDKYHATVFLGLCELIGAILCIFLVRILGKRPLIFVSLIVSAICFSSTAFYAHHYGLTPVSDDNSTISHNSAMKGNLQINHIKCENSRQNITDMFPHDNESMIQYENFINDCDKKKNQQINEDLKSWTPLILLLLSALFTHIGIGMFTENVL